MPMLAAESPLTLRLADAIADAVLAAARRAGGDAVSVVVLDSGGHLKVVKREDGCPWLIVRVAEAKAAGAIGLGRPSSVLAQFGAAVPNLIPALATLADGRLVAVPGGVLVRTTHGELVGAVGVSGGDAAHDEQLAIEGVRAAGFVPEPGP